jgi:hypothetical protein
LEPTFGTGLLNCFPNGLLKVVRLRSLRSAFILPRVESALYDSLPRSLGRISATCLVSLPNLNISKFASRGGEWSREHFEADPRDVLDRRVRLRKLRAVQIEVLVIEPTHDLLLDNLFDRREARSRFRRSACVNLDGHSDAVVVPVSVRVVALSKERAVLPVASRGEMEPM